MASTCLTRASVVMQPGPGEQTPKRVGPAVGQGQAFVRKSRNFTQKCQKVHSKMSMQRSARGRGLMPAGAAAHAHKRTASCGVDLRRARRQPFASRMRSMHAFRLRRARVVSIMASQTREANGIRPGLRSAPTHNRANHAEMSRQDTGSRVRSGRQAGGRPCISSRAMCFGTRNSVHSSLAP